MLKLLIQYFELGYKFRKVRSILDYIELMTTSNIARSENPYDWNMIMRLFLDSVLILLKILLIKF